jgi:hypothetical protein
MNWREIQVTEPKAEVDTSAIKDIIAAMSPGASVFLPGVGVQDEDVIDFLAVARSMAARMDVRRVRGKDDGVRITRALPREADEVQLFLDDCEYGDKYSIRSSELYDAYVKRCAASQVAPIDALKFGKKVTARGVKQENVMGRALRKGIRLKPQDAP